MRSSFFVFLLLLLPGAASGQRVVGRVVDAVSGEGVPLAELRVVEQVSGVSARAVTDSTGRFTVRVRSGAGRYRVSAEHFAYATSTAEVELGAQDQVEVVIRMAVTPLELPPLEVVARSRAPDPFLERAGYYDRKGGRGVFIDPDEIERRKPLNTTDLFRSISGVRVIMLGGVRGNDIRITRGEDPNCPPRVYIDRVMVRTGGREGASGMDTPLDALIQPTNLHAIEIYRSPAEIPTEFSGNYVTCGVVLIWTRRGAAQQR